MKPKNLLDSTPKVHLVGLSFILYLRSTAMAYLRSAMWGPLYGGFLTFNQQILYVNFHVLSNIPFEHTIH